MHLIVSWKIETSGERYAEIENVMKLGLQGYSWIQPLPGFFIIDIYSLFDWVAIQEKLLSTAQGFQGEVNFIMSPVYYEETDYFVYSIPDDDFYKQG